MAEELKPCPFCGGKAEMIFMPEYGQYFVSCQKCFVSTKSFKDSKKTISKWNIRKGESND